MSRIGVAAAHENVCSGLPLQFELCSLRAVCERVDVGGEDRRQRADACARRRAWRADAEVLRQRLAADAFELVVEDVVEVAGAQDELLAEDVLVDADVVGARALRALRADVIALDVRGVAVVEELRVEAVELERERGLLHAGGGVGAQTRAVEDLRRWPHGNVAEADARRAGDAVEVVLLDGAAE